MNFESLISSFARMSSLKRRLLLIAVDSTLLPFSVWLSFWFRLAHPFPQAFLDVGWWMLISVLLIGLPLYSFTGQYKGLTRYVGSDALYRLACRNGLLVLILAVVGLMFRLPMPPRISWILLWLLITGSTGAVRFCLRDVLLNLSSARHTQQLRVAIYGAGEAGAQLAAALRLTGNHKLIMFIDDNPNYWHRSINSIPIQPPQALNRLHGSIDQVLLAIPSLSRSELRRFVFKVQDYGIAVLQVPSVDDLTSGRARIDTLRPIVIEDLLGREPVLVDTQMLIAGIEGSVVCITGAGGSIGSELCRQVLGMRPKRLVLLELCEPSLYTIDQELRSLLPEEVEIIAVLGSAADPELIKRVFAEQAVELVIHAAAYKHVPIVEANPLSGISNNVTSTRVVCRAASDCGVKKVVLISTDKAVRPTNVMGASKRLAELVVQASALESSFTKFSMVRFGNVLGSSGSVVPLFRRQIAAGGPITLTHPEIIRYFMTIYEAAQLVLQASILSRGGEVFLLDMGEPVRIKDLAEQMVRLSGWTIRDDNNPGGDIEIVSTGLRPGEKLYEELLINGVSEATAHPLIYQATERALPPQVLWPQLDVLEDLILNYDVKSAFEVLAFLVPEWHRGKLISKISNCK